MAEPKLELYGHPFSSYTWKALIALYANETPFTFRIVDGDHPDNAALVQSASPMGKFPVLAEDGNLIFEATSIIEYLNVRHPGMEVLIPADPTAAVAMRMLDRVFDNYVMNTMQPIVDEYIRSPDAPDQALIAACRDRLHRSYAWLEGWLEYYPASGQITLVECAAAPSLFYADWVAPIGTEFPRLAGWRAHLLGLPPVARCIDDARPYRALLPAGRAGPGLRISCMTAQLNHTIVWCSDKARSSAFLCDILGLPAPRPFGHFLVVELSNGISMDFTEKDGKIAPQHYAFLVSEAEFDAGFAEIGARGLEFWADPARGRPGEINRHWGGRGVYFTDPDGHFLELITKPYGSEDEL